MTEIKSTMELVMERAARMGKASAEEMQQEEAGKQGMKLAAEFLDGNNDDLMTALSELPTTQQTAARRGMVEVLLRNIFLPRDDTARERTRKAAEGIVDLGGGAGDLSSICAEMQHILGQYNKHREQLKQQVEEQIRMQYEQVMTQQAGGTQGDALNLERSLQTKFQEEWVRMETELSNQYNQALEQHKSVLRERLC